MEVSTCGTSHVGAYTEVSVFAGNCNAASCVAHSYGTDNCNCQFGGYRGARIQFNTTLNAPYQQEGNISHISLM